MIKKFFFQLLFSILLLAFTLFLIELTFRLIIFREGTTYEKVYHAITLPGNKPPYVSEPYLNYINNPGFKDTDGNTEINSMGIRYPQEISLQKPKSAYRILFLGGSTTFGDVDDTYDVFPALIEKKLRDSISYLNPAFNKLECLNGGVHGLTSAELLTHFQFKYQYLQPDLIIVHTGFNDAFAYAGIHGSRYQPDYHNSRRVFRDVFELTSFEKKLLRSKAIAYLFIRFRMTDYLKTTLEDNIFFHHINDKMWFDTDQYTLADTAYNAFYNNIKTIVSVAKARGIKVLLVPEVCDSTHMPPNLNKILPAGLRLNRRLLQQIALENNVYFYPLPDKEFTSNLFLDDDGIHVNEEGEKLKAQHIGKCIQEIISQRASVSASPKKSR